MAPREGRLRVLRAAGGEVLEQFSEIPAVDGSEIVLKIDAPAVLRRDRAGLGVAAACGYAQAMATDINEASKSLEIALRQAEGMAASSPASALPPGG